MSDSPDPKTAAEGDREHFEEIRAHYDEYGFDGPTELDHERNRIIGFLLDAYDRLHAENQHLRDTDRDRDVKLEQLEAECDRLGAASVAIGESWRKRTEKAEEELAAVKKSLTRPDEQPQDERDAELDSALARIQATLDRHAARGTHGGEYLDDDIRSILNGRMIWKTAAENASAEREQLRPEYGIRAEWITGLRSEGSVAKTLGDALEALDKFDARHGDRAVSRELVVRPVGTWRRLDAEQQPEDGDRD